MTKKIGQQIQSLLSALLSQMLFSYGLVTAIEGEVETDLCGDLVDILFWDFQLARQGWLEYRLQSESTSPPSEIEIIEFFEKRRTRTERLAGGLINRFHKWLIEGI